MFWQKSKTIVMRQEDFGGIIFDRRNGLSLELDQEAYLFVLNCDGKSTIDDIQHTIEDEFQRPVQTGQMQYLVNKLSRYQIIKSCATRDLNKLSHPFAWQNWTKTGYLSAPETVHWAITYNCNLNCPYCYVKKDWTLPQMTIGQIKDFVERLAKAGVFQIAIGGGEPFLHPDLPQVVDIISSNKIVPNITTNGTLLSRDVLRQIKDKIGQLQISLHLRSINLVQRNIEMVNSFEIPFGINLLISPANIKKIKEIIAFCNNLGARQVVLLRPKPPEEDNWWKDNRPALLKQRLNELIYEYPEIKIRIDCALSFLMSDVSTNRLAYHGVYGCAAGQRFIAVLPNGDIYPCSHFVNRDFFIGNILKDEFSYLWHNSDVLSKFRDFRKNKSFMKTGCRRCKIVRYCGGCRVMAYSQQNNFYGNDAGCLQIKRFVQNT